MMSSPILNRCSSLIAFSMMLVAGLPATAQQGFNTGSVPAVDKQWPTFLGDSSGKRFSALTQIDKSDVSSLTLGWAFQTHGATIKATPLMVDGVLYFSAPDHVWAVDARTGSQVWEFSRVVQGDHVGNRGVAYFKDRIYFGTVDAHLICLDARTGKRIWDVEVADVSFGYYISLAPQMVKDLVIVGTSGDSADVPHAIHALRWDTGQEVWKTSTTPEVGEPGSETWSDPKVMLRGGGAVWMSGTYDPDLNLIYWGTANPHPVIAGVTRKGANLFTDCILAINPDTGKVAWYYQVNPHDTRDWDAVQTPILFDAPFRGKMRKLLAQASGNGYYFLLDRVTGEHLVTAQFAKGSWAKGLDARGTPIPDPDKEPKQDGTLIDSAGFGGTDWMLPSYDPQTKMVYVTTREGFSLWYMALDNNGLPEDHQGGGSVALLSKYFTVAMDYDTGKVRWRRPSGEGFGFPGILTTAGQILVTGDLDGNLLVLDPENGEALWHVRPGGIMNSSPMTYEINGKQFILTAVDSVMYAWCLPDQQPIHRQ
jgi:alcohol dehydrogenase (cytochrome c)